MVQGVVQKIATKPFGNKTFYSFAVSGVDGWFGTGVKRPPKEGTSIKFNEKTNARGYLEVDGTIEVLADGVSGPAQSAYDAARTGAVSNGATNKASGDISKDAYWRGKESRDLVNDAARELGASRNTALTIIDLAIRNEVVKLPAAAKREEFLWTLLDRYTAKLMGKDEVVPKENTKAKEEDVANTTDPESDNWS